jgi:diguanylate cyclase (GGDEF)-like protein
VASLLISEPASPERDRLVELLSGHKIALVDGGEALAAFRRERPELCLVDEIVAQQIKAEAQGFVPVIAVVPRADSRAFALTFADDAVMRPIDPAETAARITALLRTKKLFESVRAESEARSLADAATGLKNRVFLNERLNEEWKRAARYNEPLSLLIVAVESLQPRPAPFIDKVMHAVAAATLRSLRQIDVVTRFSGVELAALLPNTHFAGSIICAERLSKECGRVAVEDFLAIVTMGVAFYPGRDVQEPTDLLKQATRALERAREEGPGSICLVQHQGYLFQPKKG